METVGSILSRAGLTDSPQAADSKSKKIEYTSVEAKADGLGWEQEPPEPEACEYCGKTLYYTGVRFQNKIMLWRLESPQRCDCEQAVLYWRGYDEEAERKRQAEEEAERNRRKQERIDRLLGKSGIKKRFLSRTFANYQVNAQNRRAFEVAKAYADHFAEYAAVGDGLYFEGPFGTGKTHLASAIAIHLMKLGIPCICKTSIDMLADIKNTFDNDSNTSEKAVLSVYKDVDLLVIDDLGKEMATEWSLATLYSILNDRYEAMRPTVITTNYNDRALISRLTPRGFDSTSMGAMMSRIKGTSKVITMNWADYRLSKPAP